MESHGINLSPQPIDIVPIWLKRFNLWKTVCQKSCPVKIGPDHAPMCSWAGAPCCYNYCPRKIFEMFESETELNELRTQLTDAKEQIKRLEGKIEELQKLLLDKPLQVDFPVLKNSADIPGQFTPVNSLP